MLIAVNHFTYYAYNISTFTIQGKNEEVLKIYSLIYISNYSILHIIYFIIHVHIHCTQRRSIIMNIEISIKMA